MKSLSLSGLFVSVRSFGSHLSVVSLDFWVWSPVQKALSYTPVLQETAVFASNSFRVSGFTLRFLIIFYIFVCIASMSVWVCGIPWNWT